MMSKKTRDLMLRAAATLAALLLADCANTRILVPGSETAYRPAPGTSFVVAVHPGESLSEIAQRYRVSVEDIIAMNGLSDRDRIAAGNRLYVPAYGKPDARPTAQRSATVARAARPTLAPSRVAAPSRIAVSQLTPVSYGSASYGTGPSLIPTPRPRPTQFASRSQPDYQANSALNDYAPPANTPASGPALPGKFIWPVNGRVLSTFGATTGGGRNDGINIAVPHSTPVRAAADGTVTYVGNELKGYGNLLLIRHDNGFVTAYAHADRISVERGERVRSGDIVAYSGTTGDVTQPQLHFEIRQNTKPVNPTAYLGGAGNQASRLPRDPARS